MDFVDSTLITWGSIVGGKGSDENTGAVAVTVQELRTQQRESLSGAEGYRKLCRESTGDRLEIFQDVVDQPIFLSFVGQHELVTIGVSLDLFQTAASMFP